MGANTGLLKKTPFNGYDRDQVIDYITQMDQNTRQMQTAYETRIADITDALSQANACIESLHQSTTVLSQNLKDAQQQADAAIAECDKQKQLARVAQNEAAQAVQKAESMAIELDRLRKNAHLYEEVCADVEQLLDQARQEAENIKSQAHKQAQAIIATAKANAPQKTQSGSLLNRVLRTRRDTNDFR